MKIKVLFIALVTSLVFCSCQKEIGSVSDVLSAMQLASSSDNVLRYKVNFDFKRPCTYSVEYWETSKPGSKATTKELESDSGKGTSVIMFIKAETAYTCRAVLKCDGNVLYSEEQSFRTGSLPSGVPAYSINSNYPNTEIPGYLLQAQASSPVGYLTFATTDGDVVWYQEVDQAVRHYDFDPATGTFVALIGFKNSMSDVKYQRFCKTFIRMDLEGNILEEWDINAETVDYAHHDVRFLPNGRTAILHSVPKNYNLSPAGGPASQDVYGDGFTVLSADGAKEFTWDCFGELDPVKDSYLNVNEKYYDLVHANSVAWDEKGNWYFTLNNLNELWKIDGKTGKVLYRVGEHGNISIPDNGHTSGIHSAVVLGEDRILVTDNGSKTGVTRALVYNVNTTSASASLDLNVSFPAGLNSTDRSNCQLIGDSMIFFGSTAGRCNVFTDMKGNVLKVLGRTGISYRAFYYETINY